MRTASCRNCQQDDTTAKKLVKFGSSLFCLIFRYPIIMKLHNFKRFRIYQLIKKGRDNHSVIK